MQQPKLGLNSLLSLSSCFLLLAISGFLASCKTTDRPTELTAAQPAEYSDINLSDPTARVDTILTLAERDPRLPVGPSGFPREPWEVIDLIEALYSQSSEGLHPVIIPKNSMQYQYAYEGADYQINEMAIDQIKRELESNKRLIEEAIGRPLHSLAKDTLELKEKISKNKLDPQLVGKLLTIIPVVYMSTTSEYLASENAIQDLKHSDLANLYKDTYPEHLANEIKKYYAESVINSFENQFINKKLASALEYIKGASGKVPKMVLLEEISGFTGVFRACFGIDCSLRSVPFYALDKNTKVYLVRSHQGGSVKGYVLVTQATVNGVSYPYIVTVNGSMSADQVRAAVRLTASILKAPEIILPDFSKAGAIVNTPEMKEGMTHESSRRSVNLKMNSSWNRISEFTAAHNQTGYSNYYAPEKISTAFLGPVTKVEFSTELLQNVFKSGSTIRAKPLLERAKIAAILQGNLEKSSLLKVRETLNISEAELNAAKPLVSIDENRGLSKPEYEKAKQVLGFGKVDIHALHPLTRARVLIGLSEYQNELREIDFTKEAKDISKWAAGQLVAQTLPVENIPVYKQKIWESFIELSGRVELANKDTDAVVKARPDKITLIEAIVKAQYPAQILSSMVRLSPKSELNNRDSRGFTPLMLAVVNGNIQVVRELMQAGADPSLRDNADQTAVSIAEDFGRKDLVNELQKQSSNSQDPSNQPQQPKDPLNDGALCDEIRKRIEP